MVNKKYLNLNTSTNVFANALENIEKANKRKNEIANNTIEIDRKNIAPEIPFNVQSQEQINTEDTSEGNFFERVGGTIWETAQNVGRGFVGIFEGIIDLGVGAMGEVGSWLGADTKWAEDFVKYDVTNLLIDEMDPLKWVTGNKSSELSYVNELGEKTQNIIRGVEQAIGSSLGAIATSGITGGETSGLMLYGVGAGGQSFSEALNEGGAYTQSLLYGLASGTTEAIIEKSSDVLGNMLGLDIGAISGLQKFGTKGFKNVVGSFFSEGLEEVISDVINPTLKSIYNGKTIEENYKEDLTPSGLFETFIVGAISGGIMTGATEVYRNAVYSPEGKAIQNEMIDINHDIEEAYKEYQSTEQTTIEEQFQAYQKFEKVQKQAKEKYENLLQRTEKLAEKYQRKLKNGLENLAISTEMNSIESSINEVIDKINTTRNSNEQLDVQFVDDNNAFNGKTEGNIIYLSKNPTKALRQILTHEISHTLETNKEYKDITDKIYNQVKETEDFKKTLEWAKNNYKGQNENLIKNEAITEYISNNFFKSYKDIGQAFESKNTLDKFKDMIKNIRKNSRDNKIRDEYLKLLNKLNNTKLKNNDSIEKMSIKDHYNETVANQLNFANQTKYSLKESNDIIDKFNKNIEDLNVTLVDNVGEVKSTVKNIAQYSGSELVRQKKKMNALIRELSSAIRVNDLTLEQYYYNNFDVSNQTFEEFRKTIVDMVTENVLNDVKDLGDNIKINKLIDRMINNLVKEVNILKSMNTRSRKVTARLNNLRHWFRDKFGKSKRYSTKKLESLFENTSKELSKLRFTGTGKLEARSRKIIVDYGNTFYKSSLVESFKGNELHKEYIKQGLNYIQERVNQFESKQKISGIDTIKVLQFNDNNPLSILNGKTEAEIIVDILDDAKRILNAGNNKTVQWEEKYQNPNDIAKNEIINQLNIERTSNRILKAMRQNTVFTGLMDMESLMNIWAGSNQNSVFKEIYNSLRKGRDKSYSIYYDLSKDINDYVSSNKKLMKSLNNKVDFMEKQITKGQAIGLILTSETDNAKSHLLGEGITIEDGNGNYIDITGKDFLNTLSEEEIDLYNDKKMDEIVKNEISQKAIDNVINKLKNNLGTEFDDFMELLRNMYKQATQYYVEASDEVLGFHYQPKEIFYPTNVSSYSFRTELGNIDSNSTFVKDVFNPSFTKATVKGSKNTLKIGDALFTATSFMHALSNFAGTTIEVKKINKILNSKVKMDGFNKPTTLIEYMDKNVDRNFSKRMNRLFLAMQGINTSQQTFVSKGLKYLRNVNAKYNLGANGKVIVSQFLSYPMAFNDLKLSSLAKGLGSNKNFATFEYLVERSPYTRNRYYENNLYNAEAVGAIGNTLNTISEWTMKPIKGMDKFTLNTLWKACQAEVGFDVNDTSDIKEKKLSEAIKVFEDVAQRTQPQYDPLNNGDLTRINGQGSEIMRSILMFSSVPRKYFSRIVETFYNVSATKKGTIEHQKAIGQLAKTMSGFMASTVAMTLLTSLLKSLKGDFDDKEKDEIIAEIFKDDFATNIIGLIPFMKNIYGHIVNGYDLDLINLPQLEESIDLLFKELPIILDTNTTDGERKATMWRITQTICKLTGIPVKNVYNDVQYILGAFDKTLVLKMNNLFYNTSDNALSSIMKAYKNKGDIKKVAAVIQVKMQKSTPQKMKDKTYNELARLYINDHLTSITKIGDNISVDGKTIELTNATRTKMQNVYKIANEQLDNLIEQQYYLSLSDDEKALAIKKLYDAYYDYAKSNAIGNDTTTKLAKVLNYIDINKMAVVLAKTSKLSGTEKTNRKTLVSNYINTQRMSKAEKYLAFMLSGYSLGDENKQLISNYLSSKEMSKKEIKNLF